MLRAYRLAPPLSFALSLLLAGCAKDLELPPLSTAPVLSGLAPQGAYAGQLVRIDGRGLDPDPAANVVSFPGASARGLRFEGETLVVRVPDDAGSGPVIVTNVRGTSDPFGTLQYLGLGEPRRRAVAKGRPILHRPLAVHAVGGEVFVQSGLYGGLLQAGNGAFTPPRADLTAAAPWKGALYEVMLAGRSGFLWRVDAASGATLGPVLLPFAPTALLTMRGVDLLVAFDSEGADVTAWDLDTLATVVVPSAPAGVSYYFGAADVGDGHAVVAALDETYDPGAARLALLDVEGARSAPSFPAATLVEGTFELPLTTHLAVAFADRADPVGISTGEPLAAVNLPGGDLAVAHLGLDPDPVDTPAFVGMVETFSAADVEGLAGAATVPIVLATKRADGLAVAADLVARQLLWSVPGAAPGPASAAGDLAFVADTGGNDVSVVNLLTGSQVARVNFDVGPGSLGAGSYGDALAVIPRDPSVDGSDDHLVFPAGRSPGLLRVPVSGDAASCVARGSGFAVVGAARDGTWAWAARQGAPATVEVLSGAGLAALTTVPLPGVSGPTRAAASGTSLVLGSDGGLSVLHDAALAGTVAIPGLSGFHGLGFTPGGEIWAVPRLDGPLVVAQLWDPLLTGTLATTAVGRGTATGAVWLEDGLWVLGNLVGGPFGVLLDADLGAARTVALADGAPAVDTVSPNGRLLVERVVGGAAGETLLRFYRADPEAGFPRIDAILVEGNVQGLAFDATGERLWIVTSSPDRVLLVD